MLDQLWQSDMAPNASRYDWMRASADPPTLRFMWGTWVFVSGAAALAGLIILVGILSSVVARRNAFNQYIIALVVPDLFFSGACTVTCALNWLHSSYFGGAAWCSWQSFYVVFGICGSIWMQVVIAGEIRAMALASHEARTYVQPPLHKVLVQVACVYALSAFIACWIFIPSLPIEDNAIGGLSCLPVAYSVGSELFLWTAFLSPVAIVPLCIVGAYAFSTRHLHASLDEKTLALLSFFSTILAVLLFMWVPSIILIWGLEPRGYGLWIAFVGGVWSHVQGLVSASVYLRKPDIRQAIVELPALPYLVRLWLRLARMIRVAPALVDCLDAALLPTAAAHRSRSQRFVGDSDWVALTYIQGDLEVVEYSEAKPEPGRACTDIVNKSRERDAFEISSEHVHQIGLKLEAIESLKQHARSLELIKIERGREM